MRFAIRLLVPGLALALLAPLAHAGDNAECFTAPSAWNVPKGGAAFNRSSDGGPVGAVIDALHENFTHSAVSHGPDSGGVIWGTFSTMREPQTRSYWASGFCSAPIDGGQLGNGWPGVRTDNGGGLWAYYFSNGGYMNGETDFRYILPGSGANYNNGTANATYGTDLTVAQCETDWLKNSIAGCSGNCVGGGGYSVYQYMQYDMSRPQMCSGNIATAYFKGTKSGGGYCDPNSMTTFTYANAQVAAAASSLYNAVNNTCSNSTAWYQTAGSCLGCFDCNMCDEAADQVVTCFSTDQNGNCLNATHDWAGNSVWGKTSTTISPARVAGDYGQYTTVPANNSPWKPYGYNTVYFNSGGSVNGCWF